MSDGADDVTILGEGARIEWDVLLGDLAAAEASLVNRLYDQAEQLAAEGFAFTWDRFAQFPDPGIRLELKRTGYSREGVEGLFVSREQVQAGAIDILAESVARLRARVVARSGGPVLLLLGSIALAERWKRANPERVQAASVVRVVFGTRDVSGYHGGQAVILRDAVSPSRTRLESRGQAARGFRRAARAAAVEEFRAVHRQGRRGAAGRADPRANPRARGRALGRGDCLRARLTARVMLSGIV